jgi:hypothetical protein
LRQLDDARVAHVNLAEGNFAIQVEGQDVFLARPVFIVPGHKLFVCLPRVPHPAATCGGFGFGKFRRDDQPSLRYGSARPGCLVQKFVAAPWSNAGYSMKFIH